MCLPVSSLVVVGTLLRFQPPMPNRCGQWRNEHRDAAASQLPTQSRCVAAIPLVAAQVTCLLSDYDKLTEKEPKVG